MLRYTTFVVLCLIPIRAGSINPAKIVAFINKNPDSTWQADTYDFQTLDINDFAKQKFGVIAENKKIPLYPENNKNKKLVGKHDTFVKGGSIPENFTWATTDQVPGCRSIINHISDQGNCGCSWAFAMVDSLRDRFCLQTKGNISIHLSADYITSCSENDGCHGGYMYVGYAFLMKNGTISGGSYDSDVGCQPFSIRPCGFPYNMPCSATQSFTPKCKGKRCTNDWYNLKTEENVYKITQWYNVHSYYYDYLAREDIYKNGPMIANFAIYPDFVFYKKGIYQRTAQSGSTTIGLHAVRIVGWGVENGIRYWHAANSWGKHWGENGFFRIRRGTDEGGFERSIQGVTPNTTSLS